MSPFRARSDETAASIKRNRLPLAALIIDGTRCTPLARSSASELTRGEHPRASSPARSEHQLTRNPRENSGRLHVRTALAREQQPIPRPPGGLIQEISVIKSALSVLALACLLPTAAQ